MVSKNSSFSSKTRRRLQPPPPDLLPWHPAAAVVAALGTPKNARRTLKKHETLVVLVLSFPCDVKPCFDGFLVFLSGFLLVLSGFLVFFRGFWWGPSGF